jgi:hypothetical protein
MNHWTKRICGALAVLPVVAQAQVDLTKLDQGMAGTRTRVLVLRTAHLSGLPKDLKPEALDGVLDRLAAFKPDIITIEHEPGDECDLAARRPAKYGADYCPSTATAMAATGLDIPAALTQIDKTLNTWPAQPAAAQRRHLAAIYLAATEQASAYAQWLQLPASERHAGDSLDAALVQQLEKIATVHNENYLIAARLAARLGVQRVRQVDNHTGDAIDIPDTKAFMKSLSAAWAAGGAALNEQEARTKPLESGADLLPLYRALNMPASLKNFAEANVKGPMQSTSPERYPQWWVGGWETRNLRIVANIRETFR